MAIRGVPEGRLNFGFEVSAVPPGLDKVFIVAFCPSDESLGYFHTAAPRQRVVLSQHLHNAGEQGEGRERFDAHSLTLLAPVINCAARGVTALTESPMRPASPRLHSPRSPAFCAIGCMVLREKELAFTIVVFLSTTKGDDVWKANSGRAF